MDSPHQTHEGHEKSVTRPQPAPQADWEPQPTSTDAAVVVQRAAARPSGLRPAEVLQLQRSIGNRATQRVLERSERGPAPSTAPELGAAVQRKPDTTKYATTTRSALSPELQAGLTLGQASPTSVPSPLPDWVATGARPTDGKPYNSKERKQFAFKWSRTFANNAGGLPGVAGAGGYNEYYAQPSAGYTGDDVWGQNRVLRQTNDPDGTFWWTTADHYTTYKYVTDA